MERDKRIEHTRQCHECEQAGANLADFVAKVQQAYGEAAEDGGEVKPAEGGALVGEEDFGF